MKIVLYEPEIPGNTGNIGRLCVGSNAELHIIKPMRFFINDKYVKRAGLDYWEKLDLHIHNNFEEFKKKYPENRIFYLTTKCNNFYSEFKFKEGDIFVFGPESRGLPETILTENKNNTLTIPMSDNIRSINLSNSVAIMLYEAWRQLDFRI
ncbi:MAG: tRNA (uridine(34)/cytosine(34)/5-carboxymethylaminomethyluridine(34)-2'-O)-methyltransferase TrmL [Candidatus Cloacimonadota bacterium]|nr:tRNA (uridine(34)/cytosine(34)/5-carboxymethylaminomethyluridine(34)-2'-O)-methyltransferase TrmL [Candidatus Cloacimonadota bacterium]